MFSWRSLYTTVADYRMYAYMYSGIPSISTNLSGFGCFMQQRLEDTLPHGIYIVDRRHKSAEESIQQLTQYMLDFANQTR